MIAILYNIRSLHNVGSIFRTADAAGFEKIYLCGITPAPIDAFGRPRQALTKVSLGAEKYLKWEKIGKNAFPLATLKIIDELKRSGHEVLAVEQAKNSIPYYCFKSRRLRKKIALVLGNEIKGLPPSILKRADKILEIPMYGKKESLNVAVAFGIVAFSLVR